MHPGADPHTLSFQIGLQGRAEFLVEFGQQAAATADGDLHPQPGKHLPQFHPDHPAADHQQRCGQAFQRQRRGAGEEGHGLQPWDWRHGGTRAHRKNDLACLHRRIVDHQRRAIKPHLALDIADAFVSGQQVGIFLLPQFSHQRIFRCG